MDLLLRNVFSSMVLLALGACAGSSTTQTSTCVYVGEIGGTTLTGLKFDPDTGTFEVAEAGTFTLSTLTDLKFSPIYNNLYAVSADDRDVESFSVDKKTCRLTSVNTGSPVSPYLIGFNQLGSFAFVSTTGADVASYLHDGSSGTFGPLISKSTAEGSVMAVHPSGSFIFQGAASGNMRTLKVNGSTGLLTQSPRVATGLTSGAGISFMAVHPTGEFLYITDGTNLKHYSINPNTGDVTLAGTLAGSRISSLSFSPNGFTAYAVSSSTGELRTYMITQATGALTLRQTYTDDLNDPQFGASSETGAYYFVTTGTSRTVNAYVVNGSKLTATAGGPFDFGIQPSVIAVKTFSY